LDDLIWGNENMTNEKMKSTEEISHLDLFYAIQNELNKRGKKKFEVDMVKWHKAYFDAKLEFPEVMEHFDARFSIVPYVQELADGIHDSLHAGHLSMVSYYPKLLVKTEKIEGIEKHLSGVNSNTEEIAKYICDLVE